ncbi:hypothetical protein BSKO_11184 [Bryopsis sp. KO-2023]|nr:hypothetical protein BSKO_11184 [Bryopsis sp. KO-2023]
MGLGSAIVGDLRGRSPWYANDWKEGFNSGFRIFAPSLYIFFASAIPALAFGEQLSHDTDGQLNGVHVLTATALCGFIQAVFGGQPLLIVGVAEPIVLVYMFMFEFIDGQDKAHQFLPWAAWVCIWAAVFIFVLSILGTCQLIDKFTRFSGELFGMLIALLFLQQAIKGIVEEFKKEKGHEGDVHVKEDHLHEMCFSADQYHWRLVNGIWAVVLASGLLFTALLVHSARSWRFLKGWARTLLADYGVPMMVVLWSGISYSIKDGPKNVPRRLSIPNTWDVQDTWKTSKDLFEIDGWLIPAAMVPGFIIAALFYFDHNVSAQLAQQKEFDLKKPPAYNYDFLLLGGMTVMCGLLGIPPVNGVLPQAPMHTKSLATLKKQLKKMEAKRQSLKASKNVELGRRSLPASKGMGDIQEEVSQGIPKTASAQELSNLYPTTTNDNNISPSAKSVTASGMEVKEEVVAIEVKEQRLTGFLQSLMVAFCLALTQAIQRIPKSVLWGYFAYMAIESLPGSEFWERILLLFTDPKKRYKMLEGVHAPYLETVPYAVIVKFTLFQLAYMLIVYGITWAGIAGIAFPLAIMLLIPIRQYLMPKIFAPEHLRELDMAEYEEAPPVTRKEVLKYARKSGVILEEDADVLREKFDKEVVGDMAPRVKHHLTREQVERRKEEMELASHLRESEGRSRQVDGEFTDVEAAAPISGVNASDGGDQV